MMTKSTLFAIFTLFIGIVVGLPVTKDNEMDELVLRVNELRRMNPYQGKISTNVRNINRGKRTPVDLEKSPLLYDYYAGALSPSYDKRNLNDLEKVVLERLLIAKIYDSLDGHGVGGGYHRNNIGSNQKREFDEIDRTAFTKRNFDEIDRLGFNNVKRYDEIDRVGFNNLKRNFDEIDRMGFNNLNKRQFDEIDRVSFNGLKRNP